MHISKLIIRNFRNFNNACFNFRKGVNTLIGENGSGKTNVFHAIRLLIDDRLPIRSGNLEIDDFNRSLKDWRGHWIIITLCFDELNPSDEAQALFCHGAQDMSKPAKGNYNYYFRPKKHIRQQLYELTNDPNKNATKLSAILSQITIDDYEVLYGCRATADFTDEKMYKKHVGDFAKIIFPDPNILEEDELGCRPPQFFSIHKEVSCTFIQALRDVIGELRNARNNPLINLLKQKNKDIDSAKSEQIVNLVKGLNEQICELDEVEEISTGIKSTLQEAVGKTYAPRIDIKSELPDDMEKLMQSLTLWVGDSSDGSYQGKLSELSLGGANLIYISLKLFDFEMKQATDKMAHFLLIEEPEAHIHTHIQRTLFSNIMGKTQVIISTHSTHVSDVCKISSINVLCKEKQHTKVCHPSDGLDQPEINKIERYLDAVRSTLLFAKGVVLVEGDAELILIPAVIKEVFGITLDEIGLSLINMSSAVFEHISVIFSDQRIQRKCAIVTDADQSIVPLKKDKAGDSEFERDCRNSQEAGIQRKEKLDNYCKDNEWVNVFYSPYTFEVDFLMCGNQEPIIKSLDQIYKKAENIKTSKDALEATKAEVAGKECLRLANKVGKGWFALLVAERVSGDAEVPDHILRAIAFASAKYLSDLILAHIGKHRITQQAKGGTKTSKDLTKEFAKSKNKEEFLVFFKANFPNDPFTRFLSHYNEYSQQ